MFGAAGSWMNSVECYNVEKDECIALDGLPRCRAGCVVFLAGKGEELEFQVIGGYGESRTVSGIFHVDEYYGDGVILELKNFGKLGNIAVVDGDMPMVFMLAFSDMIVLQIDG
ncbi:F-box/kelch-repeat protein OR23-like [Papaver somniferum]|uniref:F-box/kelch-repeat protein OR23-like n=1 Tax=Papaver somniferum TaxID=3469 RepID=UPI000E6F8C12|nr:F-box/kelch-repeat protein OR23-like [Papaver somniferum]